MVLDAEGTSVGMTAASEAEWKEAFQSSPVEAHMRP